MSEYPINTSLHEGVSRPQKMWALYRDFDWGRSLLGKYCWSDAIEQEYKTKLFRTRQQARDARKTCCYKDAKVVKVTISIQMAGESNAINH